MPMKERLCIAAEHAAKHGYTPVYISLYGSQNYGLAVSNASYQSDYDYKCIVLPSLPDLVEERKPASVTLDMKDGQIDIKDIRVFADVVIRMNPAYLECLAAENTLILPGGEAMREIRVLLPALMAQRGGVFARVCCGLFEEKAKQMYHPYPAAAEKIKAYGYDGKQVHHMYRLLLMLRIFEREGVFQLRVPEEEKEMLTDLKLNRIRLGDAERLIAGWREEIIRLREGIARQYAAGGDEAAQEIRRLARRMVYAHCIEEAKRE